MFTMSFFLKNKKKAPPKGFFPWEQKHGRRSRGRLSATFTDQLRGRIFHGQQTRIGKTYQIVADAPEIDR